MRGDQKIRAVGIVSLAAVYSVRTVAVGDGAIPFLSYHISAFGLVVIAAVLMALPETLDMLPFGPSRHSPPSSTSSDSSSSSDSSD